MGSGLGEQRIKPLPPWGLFFVYLPEITRKKGIKKPATSAGFCGLDGTRTRDLRRDRAAF
jgi:hypothetical protein